MSSEGIVARSDAMHRVIDIAGRAARCDAAVLIAGEPGVGKSAIARWIHDHSRRHASRFLPIACGAFPAGFLEIELFGIRRASNDSRKSRDGLFVDAIGGTVLLSEISALSPEAQAMLLHVLETSCVRAINGGSETAVDTRVIASTSKPLDNVVDAGLRRDLFYRLNVIPLSIPPLRERRDDIPDLVNTFLQSGARRVGITDGAMRWLLRQDWPGNVQQLEDVIERAIEIADHDTLVREDVAVAERSLAGYSIEGLFGLAAEREVSLVELENGYIKRVVKSVEGNMSRAARILGIDRRTLYRKLAGR